MKRLLQALSSTIYVGDLVSNHSAPKAIRYKMYEVVDVKGNLLEDIFVTYNVNKATITLPANNLIKCKIKTFEKEWDRIFRRRPVMEVDKVKTLHDLCIEKNIEYLYNDLLSSKTVVQFQDNMFLINKMLANGR